MLGGADWLAREADCLWKTARLLDTAGGRVMAVLKPMAFG